MLTRRTETTCMIEAVGAASGRLGQERREALRSGRLGVCSWEDRRRRGAVEECGGDGGDAFDGGAELAIGFARLRGLLRVFLLYSGLGDADSSGLQIICSWATWVAIDDFAGRVRGPV